MNPEILERRSTLTDVDTKQRLVDFIAVPWEQEAEVPWRGEVWREMFVRGAFDGLEDHAGRVRVNREHVEGDTVGKVIHFDPYHDAGLLGRAKIASTSRGDETLALAADDMISMSVGYYTKEPKDVRLNKQIRLRRVLRAFLRHMAMVEAPAYEGAKVLAVRAEPLGLSALDETPVPERPALDDAVNDPVLLWAASRVGR